MLRSSRLLQAFILFSLIFFQTHSSAQNGSSSPYSRYGIGDFQFSGLAKNLGMGTVSNGINLPFSLNLSNPAGNSGLMLTTYEAGVNLNQYELATTEKKQRSFTSSLAYFAFGFPVKTKSWGLGFGLLPYSNVGYSINEPRDNSLSIPETHTYKGSGGLNQFYVSNGFKVMKKLSLGVTASYLFGVINQTRTIEFDPPLFNTRVINSASLGWFNFNFGAQYSFDSLRVMPSDSMKSLSKQLDELNDSLSQLNHSIEKAAPGSDAETMLRNRAGIHASIKQTKEMLLSVKHRHDKSDWSATIGITGSPSTELQGKNSYLAESFTYLNNDTKGTILIRDTIENNSDVKGHVKLPLNLGIGISANKGTRWLMGADFSVQDWKNFSYFGQKNDTFADSWRVAAGAQFTPKERSIKSYLKIIQYRAGAHYSRTFLQLNGRQLDEIGVSLGFGLPIRRVATMIQITAEAGKRGTTQHNLIEEKYFRVTIGFTLNDRWFVKTKMD